MGYYTRYDGEITVTPPLTAEELRSPALAPFVKERHTDYRDVKIRVAENEVETPEGVLIRRTGVAVVPVTDDSYKGYQIVEHVQELIDATGREGRTYTGRFDCEGEEAGDVWRLEIHDGKAVRVQAVVVWPGELLAAAESFTLARDAMMAAARRGAPDWDELVAPVTIAGTALARKVRDALAKKGD